jgi:hypothetical protein
MSTDIHNQIKQKFANFVDDDQAPELTNFFLKMAEESKFDEKVVAKNFTNYLAEMGADEDMSKEMNDSVMDMLRDMVIPNKAIIYPNSKKLKLSEMRKPASDEKPEEKSEEKSEEKPVTEKKSVTPVKKAPVKAAPVKKAVVPIKKADDDEKKAVKKAPVKKEKVVRSSGYQIYYHEIKKTVEENLEKDWKKKYADAPYTKNNTLVSQEIGRLWKEMGEKQKDKVEEYNSRAMDKNKANNIVSKSKSKTPENEKRPLSGFQMFQKVKKEEVLEKYRSDKKMAKDEAIKPTDAMTIVSKAWADYKKDEALKAEMDRLAAAYNEENGRKPSTKSNEKAKDKRTNPYLMFCQEFRDEYRAEHDRTDPDFDVYAESREMNKKWTAIKNDAEKLEAWAIIAHDENVARGLVEESENPTTEE